MAISSSAMRARFADTAKQTASPGRIVTMLYDRLVRDLTEASAAITAGRPSDAHAALVHAQDIVTELRRALDHDVWPGASSLDAIYDWVLRSLVTANVRKDRAMVEAVRAVVEPLAATWHEAFRIGTDER